MMIFWFVQIGSALKKLFDDGVVKREDLWITSKLWCVSNFFFYYFLFLLGLKMLQLWANSPVLLVLLHELFLLLLLYWN